MNENELKEIWQSEDSRNLPDINFEKVQKNLAVWQSKLRRKIKIDVFGSLIMVVAMIPLSFIVPKFVYFLPIVFLMMGWGYMQMWKLYKQENEIADYETTTKFLEKKNFLLTKYMKQTRIITYTLNPLIIFATFSVQATFRELYDQRIQAISILVFLEIIVVVFTEIYFGIMYYPIIKKSRELLEQLKSEN